MTFVDRRREELTKLADEVNGALGEKMRRENAHPRIERCRDRIRVCAVLGPSISVEVRREGDTSAVSVEGTGQPCPRRFAREHSEFTPIPRPRVRLSINGSISH